MKLVVTFCTRYNGVYVNPHEDEDFDLTPDEENWLDQAQDEMGLPDMTYEFVGKFDKDLTDEQEEAICDVVRNNEIIKTLFGDDLEVDFEYDPYSS